MIFIVNDPSETSYPTWRASYGVKGKRNGFGRHSEAFSADIVRKN